jgi:tetratricopeptide (TPR) repeat protein
LSHPNIVQIFEVGECDGVPYLALELAEQGTLAQRLQRFPYTPVAAAELIATLAEAVQHAHDRQVVHRDLKPANVLFTADGVAKISDFGLAKVLVDERDAAVDVTRTGETLGTPRYMAPEQAAGHRDLIGAATDVHALGTLLYECLTGCAPFMATSVPDTLQMILHDDPLPPRRWQSGIPRDLETICLQCLQKAPSARYGAAQILADDLRRFLRREPIRARRTPMWERAWKWCRRKPAHAALTAWGTLACLGTLTAAIVVPQAENRRIAGLRQEVASLMADGQAALARDEIAQAEARFLSAWQRVHGEPALADHATSVTGWLDQARNASNRYTWRQRVPPPAYDDRRDESLLLSLLLPCVDNPHSAAESAIDAALELTLPDEPRWRGERAQLHLLRVQLLARAAGPADALALLDTTEVEPSRRAGLLRGSLLDRLGRGAEADAARAMAEGLPGDPVADLFGSGMDLARNREFHEAAAVFSKVLRREPEHFAARLLQAVCCVNLGRNGEAQVALTACVAQRPFSSWSYYYRALAETALGDESSAYDDLQRVLETRPSDAARRAALSQLAVLDSERQRPDAEGAEREHAAAVQPGGPQAGLPLAAATECEADRPGAAIIDSYEMSAGGQ